MNFSEKLKIVRLLAGHDQLAFGRLLGMESATHIVRWEKGQAHPRSQVVKKIGDALNINWPWLLDSDHPINSSRGIEFCPLSPYEERSLKWIKSLTASIDNLLPAFIAELKAETVDFLAPCGGGIKVLHNTITPPIIITCHPVLYREMTHPSNGKTIGITDKYYAEQLFKSQNTQDILKKCGIINEPCVDRYQRVESDSSVSINIHFSLPISGDLVFGVQSKLDKIKTDLIKIANETGLKKVKLSIKTPLQAA